MELRSDVRRLAPSTKDAEMNGFVFVDDAQRFEDGTYHILEYIGRADGRVNARSLADEAQAWAALPCHTLGSSRLYVRKNDIHATENIRYARGGA